LTSPTSTRQSQTSLIILPDTSFILSYSSRPGVSALQTPQKLKLARISYVVQKIYLACLVRWLRPSPYLRSRHTHHPPNLSFPAVSGSYATVLYSTTLLLYWLCHPISPPLTTSTHLDCRPSSPTSISSIIHHPIRAFAPFEIVRKFDRGCGHPFAFASQLLNRGIHRNLAPQSDRRS